MAIKTIGIILNGATGRICSTQHVANVLVPIRDEGGLPAGDDRIVLDRNERGHTLLVVDSTKMSAFFIAEARRLVARCEEEQRAFTLGDGISPDN